MKLQLSYHTRAEYEVSIVVYKKVGPQTVGSKNKMKFKYVCLLAMPVKNDTKQTSVVVTMNSYCFVSRNNFGVEATSFF